MVDTQEIRFKIIDHEADVGLEICGRNFAELCMHAGIALFSLITDPDSVEEQVIWQIPVGNEEGALVVFLNELLYLWDTERFIPSTFSVLEEGGKLEVIVTGEIFNPGKHPVKKEIKAVTYHKFAIQHHGDCLKATIFLDI